MKKFNVYGIVYKHVRTTELPEGVIGYCCSTSKIIATHPDLKGEELMSTLVHEIVHASHFENGLCQVLDTTAMEVSAEGISRVMMDNFKMTPKDRSRK